MLDELIFLVRTTIDTKGASAIEIAVVEHEQNAARYEAQGFRRCSYTEFRAGWQLRDVGFLEQQRASIAETAHAPAQGTVEHSGPKERVYPRPK